MALQVSRWTWLTIKYIRPCVHRTCPALCCGEYDEDDEEQEQFEAEVNLASTPQKLQWKLYKHGLMITNFRGGAILHYIKTKAYQTYIRDDVEAATDVITTDYMVRWYRWLAKIVGLSYFFFASLYILAYQIQIQDNDVVIGGEFWTSKRRATRCFATRTNFTSLHPPLSTPSTPASTPADPRRPPPPYSHHGHHI